MKHKITILFLLISLSAFPQKFRGFGGLVAYRHTGLNNSGYASVNGGFEYKTSKFVHPQIEIAYFIAFAEIRNKYDSNNIEIEFLDRKVTATNYSFCPKINLGDEDSTTDFQILPRYNITHSIGYGELYSINTARTKFEKTDFDRYSETRHSIGIGIGLVLNLDNSPKNEPFNSIAIILYYNNIDIGNVLSNLKFKDNIHTNQTFGLGVSFYFSFKKKNIQN